MKKKIVSAFLAMAIMIVMGTIPAHAAIAGFQDVNPGDWFASAVQYVKSAGIMNGVSGSRFGPNSKTTRAQLVTILYRLDGSPAVWGGQSFYDVRQSDYFYTAVRWASSNGIVSGKGNGRFAPGEPVTRQDTATILQRYSKYKGYSTMQTADQD